MFMELPLLSLITSNDPLTGAEREDNWEVSSQGVRSQW